ncbi:MAG: VOC family protein [Zhongshania sp.]|uniref:VOC family protein n=1 Tax=Zhongshania sp. TaxID=1971902 RepID=UPI0026090B25|nr:VOC family protein [Zhongshania sp.]MDF1691874.1 VOC family protein [Zhongshania sp.]
MLSRPKAHAGMRHIALFIAKFDETLHFYTELLGMRIEWRPDPDNIYLCSGCDNLALHRYQGGERPLAGQRLDHIGFIIDSPDDVDAWHAFLLENGVAIKAEPRTHRDGARSFYCLDPDGNLVQMIYHPPISGRGA